MKFVFIFFIILLLNNCSLNKDSKYWTEDITSMTFEEYEIYIDDYTKKSKYPDIN